MSKKNKELKNVPPKEEVPTVDRHTNTWLKRLAFAGKLVTALLVALVLFWFGFVAEVREGSCAVILRFGAVRQEITEAGVYLKLPWPFETVVTYDERLQYLESGNLETTTQDKRNIVIQSYVVWQIEDPVLYHNSVGVQGTADAYINETVKSATNGTMGGYKLQELVSLEEEEIKIDNIQSDICQRVREVCGKNYGIRITDVSILRLSLPSTNLDAVFEQMRADRQKEIDTIIAAAKLKASEITLAAAEESAQIVAQGVTDAAEIKAKTEADVAKIYADAQSANIELYKFLLSLDTYAKSVDETTILVVKANEYPFNILSEYAKSMTVEGNDMVVSDLTYILSQLPEKDRKALIDGVSKLIAQSAKSNGIPME
jgi:membrane protease subunit HflC